MPERAAALVVLALLAGLGRPAAPPTAATAEAAATVPAPAGAEEPGPARRAELVHRLLHDCGSCHGLTMKGGLGPPLLPETLAAKDREGLVVTVLEGRPGTPMPPWKVELSEAEAGFMVDLLREGKLP